jgi:hypothetical protein
VQETFLRASRGHAWGIWDGAHRRKRTPAFAMYMRGRGESEFHAHAIQLPTFQRNAVSALTFFIGPNLFADFGLPHVLQREAFG